MADVNGADQAKVDIQRVMLVVDIQSSVELNANGEVVSVHITDAGVKVPAKVKGWSSSRMKQNTKTVKDRKVQLTVVTVNTFINNIIKSMNRDRQKDLNDQAREFATQVANGELKVSPDGTVGPGDGTKILGADGQEIN